MIRFDMTNVKDTRPKRRWRFRPRIFQILSIFLRLVEPLFFVSHLKFQNGGTLNFLNKKQSILGRSLKKYSRWVGFLEIVLIDVGITAKSGKFSPSPNLAQIAENCLNRHRNITTLSIRTKSTKDPRLCLDDEITLHIFSLFHFYFENLIYGCLWPNKCHVHMAKY